MIPKLKNSLQKKKKKVTFFTYLTFKDPYTIEASEITPRFRRAMKAQGIVYEDLKKKGKKQIIAIIKEKGIT